MAEVIGLTKRLRIIEKGVGRLEYLLLSVVDARNAGFLKNNGETSPESEELYLQGGKSS